MTGPRAEPARRSGGAPKVAFIGNVANSHYQMAKALRSEGEVDAHLYVSTRDGLAARPESVDPDLAGAYPAWIHLGNWASPASILWPPGSRLRRELRGHDLVIASGPGPIWAQFAGRPWCFYVTGGDITVKPFPLTFWSWYPNLPHRLAEVVAGAWQRRAVRRASQVWIQPFAPMMEAARRLHVAPSSISNAYFPLVVDTEEFRPDRPIGRIEDPTVCRMVASSLAVFHPSRLVMDSSERMRRTGQWKGNDVLIEGFAEYLRRGGPDDSVLVMPDSRASRDLDRARALVATLGIEPQVLWAPTPTPTGFPRHDMLDLYGAADVVSDEFGVGWFGYVALEGSATGSPVLTHVDDAVMRMLYPDGHPFCTARTPGEVADRLLELAASPEKRRDIGERGRAWVVTHHSPERVRERYVSSIREVVSSLGV